MKNKIAGLVAAICCTLGVFSAKAQCPGTSVVNNLSCNMVVLVQFYDCSMMVCSQNNVMVPGNGGSVAINCAACGGTSCNVSITILSINGVGITPIPKVSYSNACPGSAVGINMPTGCSPTAATLCFDSSTNEFIAQ